MLKVRKQRRSTPRKKKTSSGGKDFAYGDFVWYIKYPPNKAPEAAVAIIYNLDPVCEDPTTGDKLYRCIHNDHEILLPMDSMFYTQQEVEEALNGIR